MSASDIRRSPQQQERNSVHSSHSAQSLNSQDMQISAGRGSGVAASAVTKLAFHFKSVNDGADYLVSVRDVLVLDLSENQGTPSISGDSSTAISRRRCCVSHDRTPDGFAMSQARAASVASSNVRHDRVWRADVRALRHGRSNPGTRVGMRAQHESQHKMSSLTPTPHPEHDFQSVMLWASQPPTGQVRTARAPAVRSARRTRRGD